MRHRHHPILCCPALLPLAQVELPKVETEEFVPPVIKEASSEADEAAKKEALREEQRRKAAGGWLMRCVRTIPVLHASVAAVVLTQGSSTGVQSATVCNCNQWSR
jgi:hypothetical protein